MPGDERPVGVAVLGLGNVGSEVVRIINESADDLAARVGAPLVLRGIGVRRVAAEKGVSVNVTVLERDDRGGGKIGSVRKEGFLCETGPNGFLDNKPATMALVGRMGVEDKLLKSNDDALVHRR